MLISQASLDLHATAWNSPANGALAGGDWCDIFPISEDIVGLTIGDVSGHGESVAATMELMRLAVVGAIRDGRAPSDALVAANDVASRIGEGVVVTAIVALIDQRLQTMTFANAGHPPPLLLTLTGHAYLTHASADFPLGIFPRYRAADYVIALPGDALVVLYTDGITEHDRDPIAGEIELVAATRLVHSRPHENDAQAIALEVFRGGRGCDDAAAIALRTTSVRAQDREPFVASYDYAGSDAGG